MKSATVLAVALSAALLLSGGALATNASAADHSPNADHHYSMPRVDVSGHEIVFNDSTKDDPLFGVVDPTVLAMATENYINGNDSFAGRSSVFNSPDTAHSVPIMQNETPEIFWNQYFAQMAYYDVNLVRIGAADVWGTEIQHKAWQDHNDEFVSLLKDMCRAAENNGVYICLVLAGSQEYPTYQFGGEGSVFDTSSSAYSNYIQYCNSMMSILENENAIAMYDMFNEPDHNNCNTNYWNGNKQAFSDWASAVAADTSGTTTHPRTMGVAGLGNLFGWSKEDFGLSTGNVGFEIAHRHYYASAKDSSLFSQPEEWANSYGLPLLWGELADNSVYPLIRHTFGEEAIWSAGGQAITSMVLTGTAGYPYTGGTLPDPETPVFGGNQNNDHNNKGDDTINNPGGNNADDSLNAGQGSIDSGEGGESKGSSASLAAISLIAAIVIAIILFIARKQ